MFGHIDLAKSCIFVVILLSVCSYDSIVHGIRRWWLKNLRSVMIIL